MSTAYDFPLRTDACPASRFLRGAQLAQHVTARLGGTQSAARIAHGAGYHVDTCAQRLAESGHAPLGQMLMVRDRIDRQDAAEAERVAAEAERVQEAPVAPIKRGERRDVAVDELLALAEAGESWQASARRMGYPKPKSLAKRLHGMGDLGRVQAAFGVRIWSAA